MNKLYYQSNFCTKISDGIYWVPYNELGASRYNKNDLMGVIVEKDKLINPCELIQYVKENKYTAGNDNCFVMKENVKWEIHKTGLDFGKERKASCATCAGFVNLMLKDKYDKVSAICIISDENRGHALNYIIHNNSCYIFDLYASFNEFEKFIPIENGDKKNLILSKYVTGACLKIPIIDNEEKAIEAFARFTRRRNRLKKRQYIFFTTKYFNIPEIAFLEKSILLEKEYVEFIIKPQSKTFYITWKEEYCG